MKKKTIAEYSFTIMQLIQDCLIILAIFTIFAVASVKIKREQNNHYHWTQENEYLTRVN